MNQTIYNLSVVASEQVVNVKDVCAGLVTNSMIGLHLITLLIIFLTIFFFKHFNDHKVKFFGKSFSLVYVNLVVTGIFLIFEAFYMYNAL